MATLETLIALHQTSADATYGEAQAQTIRTADTYRMLTPQEGHALARQALARLDAGEAHLAGLLLRYLAAFVPGALNGLHAQLVERDFLDAPFVYYRADETARDLLLRRVQRMDSDMNSMKADALMAMLTALAWIGDKAVQAQFYQWWLMPPRWRSLLAIPPHEVPREAGWHLTKDGERRNLVYPQSFELQRLPDGADAPPDSPVRVAVPYGETCPSCGDALLTLFDFALSSHHPVFMGLPGERLRIVTCLHDIRDMPIYTDVDLRGGVRWNARANKPGGSVQEALSFPPDRLVVGIQRPGILETLAQRDEQVLLGVSQIGGYPAWLDGALYPAEPYSGKPMLFIGQVATADLLGDPAAPGMYYAFASEDASSAATVYQER